MLPQIKPSRETCHVELDGESIAFTLKRFRGRSSVGLIVDHRGLTVTAPRRVSDRFIVDAIRQQASWVLEKLQEWRSKAPRRMAWCDGVVISYFGEPVTLRRDLFHTGPPRLDGDLLRLSAGDDGESMRAAVVAWYRKEALAFCAPRVAQWCHKFDLPQPRVLISNADTRWGSCNVKREIRLSWRLMKAPEKVIDYVIVHEVAHLIHLNHSRAFWALVASMYPQYKQAQRHLKSNDSLYRAF